MLTKLKSLIIVLLSICCMSLALCQGDVGLKNGERPFSGVIAKRISGNMNCKDAYNTDAFTIAGRLYTGQLNVEKGYEKWVSFDIRGWDRFVTQLGIMDDDANESASLTVEIDGNTIMKKDFRYGDKAVPVEIPLIGCSVLTFRYKGYPCFAEAKLIKGDPTPLFACQQCGQQFTAQKMLSDHINDAHTKKDQYPWQNCGQLFTTPKLLSDHITAVHGIIPPAATFIVDPSDLEKLAVNLRKRVDAKPEVQEKLVKGFVAVMSFDLIEINALSIGKNVVEDLSTSLINNDFNLVERGQLDKALKELKIQDSALIDQTTALKLGEITGCNYIIVGSVSDRGQFIVINARLLETATGKSVAAERVECRKIDIKK